MGLGPLLPQKDGGEGRHPPPTSGAWEDLHKLPFLTKDDLREAYPYGLLAAPLRDCVRIQSTSGTTGKRVVAFYTQHDIDLWEECCARAIVAAGGTKEDVCHVCYGYGLFTGGPGLNGGSHKVGCLTLPMSSGNTDRQLQFMVDLGSTILCCTPSYAAYLAESLIERGLRDKIKLKAGIFGPRPGARRCARTSRTNWASGPMTSTASPRSAAPASPSSAARRRGCTSTRTTSSPRSSTPTPASYTYIYSKGNWSSPPSPRRRSPCCATAPGTSAC